MFLIRSAFWLTVAFVAMHPHDVDIGAAANALSGQAIEAGQRIVVAQILKNDCTLVGCASAAPTSAVPAKPVQTAMVASPNPPAVDLTSHDASTARSAPIPRPRPAWMG